jgi:hypothetical protein
MPQKLSVGDKVLFKLSTENDWCSGEVSTVDSTSVIVTWLDENDNTCMKQFNLDQQDIEGFPELFVTQTPDPNSYYKAGSFECREIIDALELSYNLGCVMKYVWRAGKKGPAIPDLKKAINYLNFEIQRLENKE